MGRVDGRVRRFGESRRPDFQPGRVIVFAFAVVFFAVDEHESQGLGVGGVGRGAGVGAGQQLVDVGPRSRRRHALVAHSRANETSRLGPGTLKPPR